MVIGQIQVVPVGTGSPSFSRVVREACEELLAHGLSIEVTPACTVLHGTLDQVLEACRRAHRAALQAGAERVITTLTVDERTDREHDPERMVLEVTDGLPRRTGR